MARPSRQTVSSKFGRASLTAAAAVLLAGSVAALVVSGGTGSVAATPGEPAANTVTVAGVGQANGTPDVLRLDMGVQRTAMDVSTALNAANEDIRRIKAALARHGVRDADIQTSQLSISQHYGPIQPVDAKEAPAPDTSPPSPPVPGAKPMVEPMSEPAVASDAAAAATMVAPDAPTASTDAAEPAVGRAEPMPAPDVPVKDDPAVLGTREGMSSVPPGASSPGWVGYDRPNGFDVFQALTVKLRDIDGAGAAISDAAEAGGNATRINGVTFEIEDSDGLLREARDKAYADAKKKAEQYARLAGRSLGRVTTISEGGSGGGPVPYPAAMRDSAAAGSAVPIQAGSQQVTVNATVVWELT
jgi:uncharacterized protein